MADSSRNRRPVVFYPLLLTLYPILYLFAANISLVIEREVLVASDSL
jgi:hypothetical protein